MNKFNKENFTLHLIQTNNDEYYIGPGHTWMLESENDNFITLIKSDLSEMDVILTSTIVKCVYINNKYYDLRDRH